MLEIMSGEDRCTMINSAKIPCSGCLSCLNICPRDAISLAVDERGFSYPVVNQGKCIQCGLCEKACPCYTALENVPVHEIKGWGGIHENNNVRGKSQSGGAFAALAEVVLKRKGTVYGAAIDKDFEVKQKRIVDLSEIALLQGSKYVQSNVERTFTECARDLLAGKEVLYSGTSCIIDGLLHYLQTRRINTVGLTTVDLICHGVPSPGLYKENLKRLENIHNSSLLSLNFRDKGYAGWHTLCETYQFHNGCIVHENYWAEVMYSHIALRECCYDCKYSEIVKRPADLTIADFWGVEKCHPNFKDDNVGCSLIITHTEKGEALLKQAPINLFETDTEKAVSCNMTRPAHKPKFYDAFWKDYHNNGFEHALKKYTIYGGTRFRVKRKILKVLKLWE